MGIKKYINLAQKLAKSLLSHRICTEILAWSCQPLHFLDYPESK